MGIAEQIAVVEREFVAGDILIAALMRQEQVSEFHALSWLMRNEEKFLNLPMIELNRELRDFRVISDSWACDVIGDTLLKTLRLILRMRCYFWGGRAKLQAMSAGGLRKT